MSATHVGRSWTGHPLEDTCPCRKAPCGLAVLGSAPDCPEHAIGAAKTLRQMHQDTDCPEGHDPFNDCPSCHGTGESTRPEHFSVVRACGDCHGTGQVDCG